MKEEKSCGAIVYYLDKQEPLFLLIQHQNGGHWSFPKGHVEKGENEIETALREIKEETGLTVTLDSEFKKTIRFSPKEGVMKSVVYFLARSHSKEVARQVEEISNILWLPYQKALAQITYQNDQNLLIQAQQYIQ